VEKEKGNIAVAQSRSEFRNELLFLQGYSPFAGSHGVVAADGNHFSIGKDERFAPVPFRITSPGQFLSAFWRLPALVGAGPCCPVQVSAASRHRTLRTVTGADRWALRYFSSSSLLLLPSYRRQIPIVGENKT
jgi:hypothetical protein